MSIFNFELKGDIYMTNLILSIIISLILVFLGLLLRIQNSSLGTDPFECGFSPTGGARIPFSLHFFLLALIFVVFDLEIILLLPFIVGFSYKGWVFLFILLLGLIYEWYLGSLNWLLGFYRRAVNSF